jgi:hypothetical protein
LLEPERNLTGLAVLAGASEDLVADALHELREKDLLDAEPELTQSTIPGESRREAIVRVARYGAAAAAGSLIVSATAATPAMASSGQCGAAKAGTNCCLCSNACFEGTGIDTQPECEDQCKNVQKVMYLDFKAGHEC